MKTKRIDQYICIDSDQIIIDEMNDIIDQDGPYSFKEDEEYWEKMKEAAKVILDCYTV